MQSVPDRKTWRRFCGASMCYFAVVLHLCRRPLSQRVFVLVAAFAAACIPVLGFRFGSIAACFILVDAVHVFQDETLGACGARCGDAYVAIGTKADS